MWFEYERPKAQERINFWFALCVLMIIPYMMSVLFRIEALLLLAVSGLILCSAIMGWKSTTWNSRNWKMWEALEDKEHEIPTYYVRNARILDSRFPEYILWAIECYEGHMPGDCPLCGAE